MLLDRSYFALQARFAARVGPDARIVVLGQGVERGVQTARVAEAEPVDVDERNDFDPGHPDWVAFLAAADEAFPLDVLAATSEIDVFYDHFGVDR